MAKYMYCVGDLSVAEIYRNLKEINAKIKSPDKD